MGIWSLSKIRYGNAHSLERDTGGTGGCPSDVLFPAACLHLKERDVSGHRQGSAFLPTALQGPRLPPVWAVHSKHCASQGRQMRVTSG